MITIAVMIATPTGTCLLVAASERDAATTTEATLVALPPSALPVSIWVQCADEDVCQRLGRYFTDLQADLTAVSSAHLPANGPE